MQNVAVSVEIPWQVAGTTPPDIARLSQELRVLWIVDQVRRHRVGIGKGAELAELPRAAFMQLLGEHGVPVIDYALEDLEEELRTLGGGLGGRV
jgi:predicted HTH domain antitoxin